MRKNSITNPIQQVPFSYYKAITVAASSGSMPIHPSSFPRVNDIADTYDCYRVTKLKYRLFPNNVAAAANQRCAIAYYPGVVDSPPSAVSDVSENITHACIGPVQTVPSAWVEVPRELLRGQLAWYKTIAGSPDPIDEVVGNLYGYTDVGTTSSLYIQIEGVFEFKGATNTGATPAERLFRRQLAEKKRLMSLLTISETGLPSSSLGVKKV